MDPTAALLWIALQAAGLQRPRIAESISVMHAATMIATPSAVTTLSAGELRASPALTLDDALRSVPGFGLFRRSSSRVANPTTQGATLRGLAASGASRALVLADGVPLNDPFGGWVYWNRIPLAIVQEVAVARGASGDQHGGEALAGVVTIHTARSPGTRVFADAGSHGTARLSAAAGRSIRGAHAAGAVETATTDGFHTIAPESRGPVDERAASRHASGYGSLVLPAAGLSVTASHFRESRRNGTPLQRNASRASHVASAIHGVVGQRGGWSARAHLSDHRYEQSFSAVSVERAAERPTAEQLVGTTAYQGRAQYWRQDVPGNIDLALEASLSGVAADLLETPFDARGLAMPSAALRVRQSGAGASARVAYRWDRASAGAALRIERWRTAGNRQIVADPRLWISVSPGPRVDLTAAVQSGFRPPTINELHRPFRVGNVLTEANPTLAPERARGVEAGAVWYFRRATIRALTFWSRVDDAIVNVTRSPPSSTAAQIVRRRENAARIRAAGGELESEVRLPGHLRLIASSSYTRSVFTTGHLQGRRVPQVPRLQHAAGLRGAWTRITAAIDWRYSGRQFDDDQNVFALDRSTMVDARAGWRMGRRIELFAAIENACDEEQDVGRTPLRTTGLPRTSRAGLRVTF